MALAFAMKSVAPVIIRLSTVIHYWYDNFIDWSMLSGLDVWIARYGDTIQAPDKAKYSYTIWQSTDGNTESGLNPTKGLIAGIPSWNDSDRFWICGLYEENNTKMGACGFIYSGR